MASIERTAYPRFKSPLTSQECADLYTPTPEELTVAQRQTPTPTRQFFVLVLLKAFQRLGYFPKLAEIPLDRLGRRLRTGVNYRFFVSVFQRLSGTDQERLDALLVSDPRLRRSPSNGLKQVPKRPTLTHLQERLDTISPGCCPSAQWTRSLTDSHP